MADFGLFNDSLLSYDYSTGEKPATDKTGNKVPTTFPYDGVDASTTKKSANFDDVDEFIREAQDDIDSEKRADAKGAVQVRGSDKTSLLKFPADVGATHIPDFMAFHFLDLVEKDGAGERWSVKGNEYGHPIDVSKHNTAMAKTQPLMNNAVVDAFAKLGKKTVSGTEMIGMASKETGAQLDASIDSAASALKSGMGTDTTYKYTHDSIYLMMPPQVSIDTSAGWQAVNASPTGMGMLAHVALGDSKLDSLSTLAGHELGGWMSSLLLEQGKQAFEAGAKKTFNPFVSQAFEAMNRRTFKFDWLLTPKNNDDLKTIKRIIYLFRYHMHPSLSPGDQFLKYPSRVDVEFKTESTRNPWMPKITTCVIKDFSVNYTPNNQWATVDSPEPGAPYQYQISLVVEEIVPLVKQDLMEGY